MKRIDWEGIGELGKEESRELSNSPSMKRLILAFQDYPVKWANSIDLLYSMRKEEADKPEREEKRERQKPWVYQNGKIFKARFLKQTERAFLLRLSSGVFWVPKGQVDWEGGEIWLPNWLVRDKGLRKKDEIPGAEFEWEPALVKEGKVVKPLKEEMRRR